MSQGESISERGQKVRFEVNSVVAEAYRRIRTAVFFSVTNTKAKTLLVTSPSPRDGKTIFSSNLAIAIAQAGQKTLILDADFRKPMQQEVFQVNHNLGFAGFLSGKIQLEYAIQPTFLENLELITAGTKTSNPSEMLNGGVFENALKVLMNQYDRIIVDSPPVLSVTDACILAALCDATLLVLKADKSTKRISQQACDSLLSVGANLLGIVVNEVSKKSSLYSYPSVWNYGYYGRSKVRNSSGNAAKQ
jgi:capsular exopolysaccharide synthesis family protein